MKKAFKILSVLFACAAVFIASSATAQTNQNLFLRNSNNNLFRYGYEGVVTTTNNTATTIASFPIGNNEAGMLTAEVIGFDSTNGDYVQGVVTVGYVKSAGTLTLDTPDTLHAISGSGGLSGGTFAFSAVTNNVVLKVTGANSVTVSWIADVRWIKRKQ